MTPVEAYAKAVMLVVKQEEPLPNDEIDYITYLEQEARKLETYDDHFNAFQLAQSELLAYQKYRTERLTQLQAPEVILKNQERMMRQIQSGFHFALGVLSIAAIKRYA